MSWWEHAYRSGHVMWDPGAYDGHLPWLLSSYNIKACRVLDPGCGNGKSAVWLAEQGFHAVGIDMAPSAVSQAKRLARAHGVEERTEFYQARLPDDVPTLESRHVFAGGRYDLIIERAFIQHLGHGAALRKTMELLARALSQSGVFYSLMIATEGASGRWGITRWSEDEIRAAVEPSFRIVEMRLDVFTPDEPGSVSAWITVMEPKRRHNA